MSVNALAGAVDNGVVGQGVVVGVIEMDATVVVGNCVVGDGVVDVVLKIDALPTITVLFSAVTTVLFATVLKEEEEYKANHNCCWRWCYS